MDYGKGGRMKIRAFSKKDLIEASKEIEGMIHMKKEDMKVVKLLLDKEDIKKMLAMNQMIVDVNCALLRITSVPTIFAK